MELCDTGDQESHIGWTKNRLGDRNSSRRVISGRRGHQTNLGSAPLPEPYRKRYGSGDFVNMGTDM